jgi:hypothetical protein
MLSTNCTVNPYFTVGVFALATSFLILTCVQAFFFIVKFLATVFTGGAFTHLFVATAGQLITARQVFVVMRP